MQGGPHSGSEIREAPDPEIGNPGQDRCQIVTHGDLQPAAAFHDRENRCNLRSCQWAADVYPVFSTQCHRTHGILARLVLSSNSGYSKKHSLRSATHILYNLRLWRKRMQRQCDSAGEGKGHSQKTNGRTAQAISSKGSSSSLVKQKAAILNRRIRKFRFTPKYSPGRMRCSSFQTERLNNIPVCVQASNYQLEGDGSQVRLAGYSDSGSLGQKVSQHGESVSGVGRDHTKRPNSCHKTHPQVVR